MAFCFWNSAEQIGWLYNANTRKQFCPVTSWIMKLTASRKAHQKNPFIPALYRSLLSCHTIHANQWMIKVFRKPLCSSYSLQILSSITFWFVRWKHRMNGKQTYTRPQIWGFHNAFFAYWICNRWATTDLTFKHEHLSCCKKLNFTMSDCLFSNSFQATYPINFGIYCFMSSSFRQTFRALFCRQVAHIN